MLAEKIQGAWVHMSSRTSRCRLWAFAAGLVCAFALVLVTRDALAVLIPQMARCAPPVQDPAPNTSPTGPGWGNDAAGRTFQVRYAWARGDATKTKAQNIADTHRVEICWIDKAGTIRCPGWHAGGLRWVLFDDGLMPIGTKPAETIVKSLPGEAAKADIIGTQQVPIDWDDPTWVNRILFFAVNAQVEPTTLASVTAGITDGGFCGVPFRLAAGGIGKPSIASAPGSQTPADVNFVLYALPPACTASPCPADRFEHPGGWPFGTVCTGQQNRAGLAGYGGNICVNVNTASPDVDTAPFDDAARFGLNRLAQFDDWQFRTVQGGLPAAVQRHTWENGTSPGAGSTCAPGATCPTRVFWVPIHESAGYGWGGMFSEVVDPYVAPLRPWDGNAESLLRHHAHEFFHGLQETWVHHTQSKLYNDLYISESTATVSEAAACLTNYPTDMLPPKLGGGSFVPPPTKCVSSRTLYGPYYGWGGLLSANDYLTLPEKPLAS
jgi:hypothetical protein